MGLENLFSLLQFVYDSETKSKDDSHNALLKEIQGGIKLKKVKTNDRSKPNIDGEAFIVFSDFFLSFNAERHKRN